MTATSKQPRSKFVDSLHASLHDAPLAEHILSYSDNHLKDIAFIANFRTSFFQNIAFFNHNHFEIRVWLDLFTPTDPGEMDTLEPREITPLFLQGIALYRVSLSLGLDFINFCHFRRLPGNILQFAVVLPSLSVPVLTKESRLKELLRLFQGNPTFHNLNEANHLEFFYRLSGDYTFNENQAYLYRFDDLAVRMLHSYPLAGLKNGANIKINIKTPGPIQKKMVRKDIINHLVLSSENTFLADIGCDVPGSDTTEPLHQEIARMVPGLTPPQPEDFIAIIDKLTLFLQQSSFTSMLLLVERLSTKQDAEFLNYLLEVFFKPNIILICFDAGDGLLTFDLELNENPTNAVTEFLGYGKPEMDANELRVLRAVTRIPAALEWHSLQTFFPVSDVAIIENLIKRQYLKVSSGKVLLGTNRIGLNMDFNTDQGIPTLPVALRTEAGAYPGVQIGHLIRTHQWEELKSTLIHYLKSPTGFDVEFQDMEGLLFKHLLINPANMEILSLLMAVLVEGNNIDAAHHLKDLVNVNQNPREKSLFLSHFLLALARLCHVEKNHRHMEQLLEVAETQWDGNIPKSVYDLFHYLKYLSLERKANRTAANRHYKAIRSELYQKRAAVLWCDRHIYRGEYLQAEDLLQEAAHFFNRHHFRWDELETRGQQAKLAREKGNYAEAEKSYKNIFLTCEMNNYPLLAANICIDLGNLYWVTDNFKRADTWYRKALQLYQAHGNKNGINTVESNLAEISKINGNWEETTRCLESILIHDKEDGTTTALAVDYYNIGHLEYLKHHIAPAFEFVQKAIVLFKEKENLSSLLECEFLKLHLDLLRKNGIIDVSELKEHASRVTLSRDQKVVLSVLQTVASDPQRLKSMVIVEKVALCLSHTMQFQLIAALLHRYPAQELLERLKILSMALSQDTKNYYFYEYYYIYYCYFFNFEPAPSSPALESSIHEHLSVQERNRFIEVYYFFLQNGRTPAPSIAKNKQWLDKQEAASNLFKRAEWVEECRGWKFPEDFFNSFVLELQKIVSMDLLRLAIYERSNIKADMNMDHPLFDFSKVFSGEFPFRELTTEINRSAFINLDHLTLTASEIKKKYHSQEKAFYAYDHTMVIFWKLSESLLGVLLLATDESGISGHDFYQRHKEFFWEFGALIHRYYETVYQLNSRLGFIIGESQAVTRLKEQILKVSKVDFALLVYGESGSGKELVAKAVHLLSRRSGQPFVPVNAAAIPENLLEAELFGYKKGAFTGANENKTGLIESASGGTLFLDEIADLPLNLQAKMLRVLQESEIRRLGENKTSTVDIRLICATNKDLKEMIATRQFREDLYFRIQDLTLHVPSLPQRIEDIPLLVTHFLQKYGFAITDKSELQRIFHYFSERTWTGNIRELESSVKRLITYYPDFELESHPIKLPPTAVSFEDARAQFEKTMVIKALEENQWRKIDAAASLKISRQYLFKLIKKYQLIKK